MAKKLSSESIKANAFLNWMAEHEEAKENMKNFLKFKPSAHVWRGYAVCPPGTALEKMIHVFEQKTNIPLELPLFIFMFFLSAKLFKDGVTYEFGGKRRTMEQWLVLLAGSGGGKTLVAGIISRMAKKLFGVESNFSDPVSAAMFFEQQFKLDQSGEKAIWVQDEFAQKLKAIESGQGPLAEAKDLMLKAFDGQKNTRSSKKDGERTIENSKMCILGLNTTLGFTAALSAESLIDGFSQRYAYVEAATDIGRPFQNYPLFPEDILETSAANAFQQIGDMTIHPHYKIGPEAHKAYENLFGLLFDGEVSESFYRRCLFMAARYAVLYHLITGDESDEISVADMSWAGRIVAIHLSDCSKLIQSTISPLARMYNAAIAVKNRCEATGKPFNSRAISLGVSGIKSASEAKSLYDLVMN
jgi:hypothetical protein